MPERPLFPNGALARSDAPFRDPSGANAFRDPADATAIDPASSLSAGGGQDVARTASPSTAPYADLDASRLAGAANQAVQSGSTVQPIDSNIFASPQAGGIRTFQSGDFATTQGDNSATLLIASQIALALAVLGAIIVGAVLIEFVFRLFLLMASGLFIVGGGVAMTVLIRGWNNVSLQRLGVMRRSEGTAAKWAVGYAAFAIVLALSGLGGITVGWLR